MGIYRQPSFHLIFCASIGRVRVLRTSAAKVSCSYKVLAMRLAITLFATVATISTFSQAQSSTLHQDGRRTLVAKLSSNDYGLADAACDMYGNAFVTVYDTSGESPADRPLLMFDAAGKLKTSFPSSRKALNLSSFEDHHEPSAVLKDGGVARLVWANKAMYLALFNATGELRSRTKLDPPAFFPSGIVMFPSGELLVSGLEHVHSVRALSPYKIFTALYDTDGHLQKRLTLPEDAQIEAAAEIGDARYARGPMFGNSAVSYGQIRLGEDGNAYLMRRTSPATVYVISFSGELLRTLMIEPAEAGQMPFDMQVAGGRVAVQFSDYCSDGDPCYGNYFTVADAVTGEKLADYTGGDASGVFVCYSASPDRFSVLRISDEHALSLVEAKVK